MPFDQLKVYDGAGAAVTLITPVDCELHVTAVVFEVTVGPGVWVNVMAAFDWHPLLSVTNNEYVFAESPVAVKFGPLTTELLPGAEKLKLRGAAPVLLYETTPVVPPKHAIWVDDFSVRVGVCGAESV